MAEIVAQPDAPERGKVPAGAIAGINHALGAETRAQLTQLYSL